MNNRVNKLISFERLLIDLRNTIFSSSLKNENSKFKKKLEESIDLNKMINQIREKREIK